MKILNPVMRTLGASIAERATAFYRDVLGFEVCRVDGAVEATSGPARIRFDGEDLAAVVYFEVDDLAAMHAAIRARGGDPTPIAEVNWIKIRVFTLRDPEGHTLWFGQSFDHPDERVGTMMQQALPELPFSDVAAAVIYYRDVLGFKINYQQNDLGVMDRDAITVLLIERTSPGAGSFEVYIEDADDLYTELKAKGARVQAEPVSHPWGLRAFQVLDLEGNRLTFAQRFE